MSLNKEFIPLPSTNGVYGINRDGSIKRLKTGQGTSGNCLKVYCESNGYKRVRICLYGKTELRYIHRLLAEVFLDNPENKPCVNHIDGNKLNNTLINLEWVSYSENTQHAVKAGLHKIGEDCYNYKHGKYSRHSKGDKNV